MTIKSKNNHKPFIDVSGPGGNAYAIIGCAVYWAKKMGKDHDSIVERMMAGDYENLLSVFDSEFGEFIDIFR